VCAVRRERDVRLLFIGKGRGGRLHLNGSAEGTDSSGDEGKSKMLRIK